MMAATSLMVETPSGKDVAYENFPVGSWLLPAALRPHVATFYAFARSADDIADNPDLTPDEKIARLNGYEDALLGRAADAAEFRKAADMRMSLAATGVPAQHCVDLLAAFKQDATKRRYDDWDELVAYCMLSAASVGRYMVDLHGGSRDGHRPSDALCIALQIINHLQDAQDDYRQLDRVYLPMDWMAGQGAKVEDLDAAKIAAALRRVFDLTLDGVDALMVEARALPVGLASRRLAMESAAIVRIAERLIVLLRRRDPLARRVELTKAGYLWACCRGAGAR
ncbi:MAG: squalene synthase HpnC, partial [Rhodospirillales bacterium]